MRIYRAVWLLGCAALGLLGVGVALLLSPAAVAVVFLGSAVAAMVVTEVVARTGRLGAEGGSRLRRTGTVGVLAGSTAAAFVGLAVALGAGVFLLVVVLVVGSPATVGAYGRWLTSTPGDGVGRLHTIAEALSYAGAASCGPYQPVPLPVPLSDRELTDAWSATYVAMQQPTSTAEHLRLIDQRAAYLAEFERRNPGGLTTWLASGASPAGIPLVYLVERRAAYPAIDWDALISGQDS
jgi:hypothetical protein